VSMRASGRPLLPSVISRLKNAELLIIPVLSGYGPSVSEGVTAQLVDVVPPVVVVEVLVLVLGLAGEDDPQPASAAPNPALSTASNSRRCNTFDI
jgi:hypothetical protein